MPDDLKVNGVVKTDQLKNLDFKARNSETIENAPEEIVEDCLKKIRTFL
ncbi:hypothetical protein GCM10007971_12020 [Oceanobacillus indicireducens]|uniref:Type II toxin-antitoxin system PemK/MazF family toxin n=1 Tax=Oceanobacillus indicireducens TaxID=1004261 RepID=A0A917XWB5_9BACI|nr:hypothetical protein GCM10007971_12020 [Oceanobacillus indicireducens]